jgi:hypothetical protein
MNLFVLCKIWVGHVKVKHFKNFKVLKFLKCIQTLKSEKPCCDLKRSGFYRFSSMAEPYSRFLVIVHLSAFCFFQCFLLSRPVSECRFGDFEAVFG